MVFPKEEKLDLSDLFGSNMYISAKEFKKDIDEVISLLEKSSSDKAKEFFVGKVKPKYKDLDLNDINSNLLKIIIVYYNLSEFFLNGGATHFGILTKEEIIDSYYSKEFQDDLVNSINKDKQ